MKRILVLLMLFAMLGFFFGSIEVHQAKALTVEVTRTFYSETSDGYLTGQYINYATCHDYETGTVYSNTLRIGQSKMGVWYYIFRGAIFFDTSIIPDDINVTEAKVSLRLYANYSSLDFNITLQTGGTTYPHNPLETGDYYYNHYSGDGGQFNTSGLSSGYNNITLNAQGMGWINVEGITKFMLRSDRDINSTAPSEGTDEQVWFYNREDGTSYAPILYVTYETEGYNYIVHGPYYENGTVANVNVSLNLEIEYTDSESYILDGAGGADTLNITSEQRGVAFTWNLTSSTNITRTYYLTNAYFEEIWVFLPRSPYYFYTFSITDQVGLTNAYLEVIASVQGQNRIVERQSLSIISSIPFWLTFNKHYEIRVISDQGTYSWGSFIPATSNEIPLIIRGVKFPKETLLTCKYVRIYGLRRFGTPTGNITIYYEDLLNMTNSVTITLKYRNDSEVNSTIQTDDTFTYTFLNIYNNTDYKVECQINHQRYGTYPWKQYFPRRYSSNPWGCLAFLGSFPEFDISLILSIFAIILAGGSFTVLNPEAGAFVACVTATILCVMGWFQIPAMLLIAAWILTIIYALARAKQTVIVR